MEAIMKRPSAHRNWNALISLHPLLDWQSYLMTISLLLMFVMIFIMYLLWGIVFVLDVLPIKFWLALIESWPQVLWVLLGGNLDAAHSREASIIRPSIVFLILMMGAYLLAKRAIKDFRGLITYSCAGSSSPSLQISKMMHVFLPLWLHARVIDAPSPTTVLDLVQEQESTAEAWSQEVATALEDSQKQAPPAIRIRLSLTDKVTITLIGQDGKQERCTRPTPSWAALIVYLALQNLGAWVPRDTVLQQVYGGMDDAKSSLLKMHINRIHKFLLERATQAGLLTQTGDAADGASAQIVLIEDSGREKDRAWRLSPFCEVDVYSKLVSIYERLREIQEKKESQPALTREEFNSICQEARLEYGKGFMAGYEGLVDMWYWLEKLHKKFRDMCLYILDNAARSERIHADGQHLAPGERAEAMTQLALYYEWY